MIVGVTTVKNEADIIEPVLRHHIAEGCDRIIVADNLSTDGTSEILARLAEELPLTVVADTDPGHRHGEKMTALARRAAAEGATWVLTFDADEFWYSDAGTVAEVLAQCPPELGVLVCQGWDHIAVSDGISPWREPQPQQLPKVIFRASPDVVVHEGQHGVDHPLGAGSGPINYRHFQYRSFDHFRRKVRDGAKAADTANAPPDAHAHWRHFAAMTDTELHARYLVSVSASNLVFDPPPIRGGHTVAVIIPTLNPDSEMIADCLAASGVEPVVVHDEHREGFAHTCNAGAASCTADVLVFLNDDTIPQPGWLDALTRRVGWGVAGSLLTYPDGTVQHSGVFLRRTPTGELEAFNRQDFAESAEVPAVTGACLAVTRELWDELGGFDEDYRNGYEDVDFCLRARQHGHHVFFAADSHVVHLESRSAGRFDHAADNIALLQQRFGDLEV